MCFDDHIVSLCLSCVSDDDVYVEDEKERAEYVLNEFGRIWCSPYSRGTHWVFGQVSISTFSVISDKITMYQDGMPNPLWF